MPSLCLCRNPGSGGPNLRLVGQKACAKSRLGVAKPTQALLGNLRASFACSIPTFVRHKSRNRCSQTTSIDAIEQLAPGLLRAPYALKSGGLCSESAYKLIDNIGYMIFGGRTLHAKSVFKATKPRLGRPKSGLADFKLQPGIPKPMLKASKARFVDQQPWLRDLKPRLWKSPKNLKEPKPNS